MGAKNTYGMMDAVGFAAYLIKRAQELGFTVNVTKLQKWLYVCYGLYLAAYGEQLFNERPKAWDYGPVFPKVHRQQVKNKLEKLVQGANLDNLQPDERDKCNGVVDAVLGHFGNWMATELVEWTHTPNMAWDRTVKESGKYATIDNFDIYRDFKEYVSDEEV